MSTPLSRRCVASEAYPAWFADLIGAQPPRDGEAVSCHGRRLLMRDGLLRDEAIDDAGQRQTGDAFGFKWAQRATYASEAVETATRNWLIERYGDLSQPDAWAGLGAEPMVLDAGCGAGLTARLLIGPMLDRLHYVGSDISSAVDDAVAAFQGDGRRGVFLQADLCALPFPPASFDFILSEGVRRCASSPTTSSATAFATSRARRPGAC
jgi:arsenite methyltransferase